MSATPALQVGAQGRRDPSSAAPASRRSRAARGPRRERVERNIYRRTGGGRPVFEVGFRDSAGKQRWRTVVGGITAARAARDDLLGRKARGERVQPNPGLRFNDAADSWLDGQVSDLRPATQTLYEAAVRVHLRPRWGRRRLDAITVDDVARLVRELRAEGKSEWTIKGVLKAASRIFQFAGRRMGWFGANPVTQLDDAERPRTGTAPTRRIYQGDELAQTLSAAHEPFRTLFSFAAVTGARLSECLGLRACDLDLADPQAATATIAVQVDRKGRPQPLKTEESRRTLELPPSLAQLLIEHRISAGSSEPDAFVFASRSGRALMQRNVMRALRQAQKRAVDHKGEPTFPALHRVDDHGQPIRPSAGTIPSFHSFRHTAASEAIAAGESAEEVAWQLGHRTSVVTRAIYIHEVRSAERRDRRRKRLHDRYAPILHPTDLDRTGTA
jgi:integrase